MGGHFPAVESFVETHRSCEAILSHVGDVTPAGYSVRRRCSCGARFVCWVTPEQADLDLVLSGLSAFPN
jgi:hypothetical protein